MGGRTADSNPDINGYTARIGFSGATLAGSIVQYSGGVPITYDQGTPIGVVQNTPGVMTLRLDLDGGQAYLYWNGHLLVDSAISVSTTYTCIKTLLSQDTIQLAAYLVEYFRPPGQEEVPRNQRYDKLVAVSDGNLWRETTQNNLEQLASSITFTDDYQLTAVDREQKLYIADYGASKAAATGVINKVGTWRLSDAGVNWSALGITTDYILSIEDTDYTTNEQQRITLNYADGGYWTITFQGQTTIPILPAASAASVKSALEALAGIYTDDVIVTGASGGPYLVEFQNNLGGRALEKMICDSTALTYSGAETPSIRVDDVQEGSAGTSLAGNYTVTGVYPDYIEFTPPLPSSITGSLTATYSVAKPPKVYNAQTDTLQYLAATTGKGTVPVGCRIVTLYRDRLVLAARDETPHIFYMSRQGDPNDWDYSQEDSGAAVFAQASLAGQLADPITALIPHSDECLVVGCYNSLWMLRGDPGLGGTVDQISRQIGIVGPHAWCRTPEDMVVFLSPDGLYVMASGCNGFPTSLSRERLPDELVAVTTDNHLVTMEYDVVDRGIHIFVTDQYRAESAHWFFDWEAKAFWRVKLQEDHEPTAIHKRYDWASGPVVLLGCRDGYIRKFSRAFVVDDDDTLIDSYCMIGPFHLDRQGYMEGILTELTAHVGDGSGDISFDVLTGDGHESAYRASPAFSGTWERNGLNYSQRPRTRGVSAIIKVKGGGERKHWFLERITATVCSAGRKRVR